MKYLFSGHESFICKHFWLKKGYDFINENGDFQYETAVMDLGVGKNMVNSIEHWMKSYGLLDKSNSITEFSKKIFKERGGLDSFIESLATIWLLHYSLIKTNRSSLYSIFFNDFRKGRTDFTKEQLLSFLKRQIEDETKSVNDNTLNNDISVFIRSYLKPSYKDTKIEIEEDFLSLMIDLDLMKSYKSENAEGKIVEWYQVENKIQVDLPAEVVFFAILDNTNYGKSISFQELLNGFNSPGVIFALNEEGLFSKLDTIVNTYKGITMSETAGIRELQLKTTFNKWDIINDYYKK
jgi:Protein of unknown function (DUF4007)